MKHQETKFLKLWNLTVGREEPKISQNDGSENRKRIGINQHPLSSPKLMRKNKFQKFNIFPNRLCVNQKLAWSLFSAFHFSMGIPQNDSIY